MPGPVEVFYQEIVEREAMQRNLCKETFKNNIGIVMVWKCILFI